MLTYADMITLLLALFIFLYSISEINSAKLNAFTDAMAKLFGIGKVPESSSNSSGGSGILPQANAIVQLKYRLEKEFAELIQQGLASVEKSEEGLRLRLKDQVLFDLGRAELSPEAGPIVERVAKYLKNLPNPVRVEGHTDDLPVIPGGKYGSNWELSGARAASVVRFMIERCGLPPERLSLAGYAQYKPVSPNNRSTGNADNRRVEIVVLSKLAEESPNAGTEPQKQHAEMRPENGSPPSTPGPPSPRPKSKLDEIDL